MSDRTPRLYSDLAWLWPMWGDPSGEYSDIDGNDAEQVCGADAVNRDAHAVH